MDAVTRAIQGRKRGMNMQSYRWWLGRKKRVRKKYKPLGWRYLSPKELREWYDHWTGRKRG